MSTSTSGRCRPGRSDEQRFDAYLKCFLSKISRFIDPFVCLVRCDVHKEYGPFFLSGCETVGKSPRASEMGQMIRKNQCFVQVLILTTLTHEMRFFEFPCTNMGRQALLKGGRIRSISRPLIHFWPLG